jgi:F0F1-type ATP synthase epsilon subunit
MASPPLIKVKIRNSQEILFEGEVDRITSINEMGNFDVFPMHANFISIIKKGVAIYKNRKKIKEIKFDQAILKVKHDVVDIYVGIEELFVEGKQPAK